MKRLYVRISVALAVLVMAALYLVSPLSKSTRALRVLVEREGTAPQVTGYRAIIVNDGYLPVFVGTCETVDDAMNRDVVVLDALQRWRPESGVWGTVLDREQCRLVPTGVIEAKFTRKLLWPRQRLHTTSFFPNVGFSAGLPFHSGDKLRFVVFTRTPKQDSDTLSSPEFIVE